MSNLTAAQAGNEFQDDMIYVLPPLFIFHGVGAATLSTSSFLTVFPVLAAGFNVDVLTALSISILVDAVNGVLLSCVYRKYLVNNRPSVILLFSGAGATIAAIFAHYLGIGIIREYDSFWRNGAGYTDFFFAFGFFYRGYTLRKQVILEANAEALRVGEGTPKQDMDSPKQILKEKLKNHADDYDEEEGAPQPAKLINVSVSQASARSMFRSDSEKIKHEPLPPLCSKDWAFPIFAVVVIAALSGMIGFGSGNIVAIVWIYSFKWDIVPATAVGSVFSALVMAAVFSMFLIEDVNTDLMKKILPWTLPLDIVAVLAAANFAQLLNEEYLSILVGFIFLAIGIGVTVVSLAF